MADLVFSSANNSPQPSLFQRLVSWFADRAMHRQADIVLSHTSDRCLYDMGMSRQYLHRFASGEEDAKA
ncbi:hypothetical protein [Pontibaca salina]|uniref:DUF1127 domain-containing protein n=1 Tax=Pontibaca salina TaxID=2795731 RepID=A0A934LYM6_9RHOB|nr:hypothetical protein [Pontibaca salina]MBI6629937.1 hypothetical protein [Pontibaca salina]